MLTAPWRVQLLGGFRVTGAGRSFTRCSTRKAEELLAALACRLGDQCSREDLAVRFWPDSDTESAQTNLRVALSSIRRNLEPPGVERGTVLTSSGRSFVGLNPEAVTCDVVDFRRLLKRRPDLSPQDRIRSLLAAIDLYHGELMPGHYGDWIEQIREQVAELFFTAMRELTATMAEVGAIDQALEQAQRAIEEDPLREESHRELMQLYTIANRPDEAVRAYENMQRVFNRESMGAPSPETVALVEKARRSIPEPPPDRAPWTSWETRNETGAVQAPPGGRGSRRGGEAPREGGAPWEGEAPREGGAPWEGEAPAEPRLQPDVAEDHRSPVAVPPHGQRDHVHPAPTTALPMEFAPLFGREAELRQLEEFLGTSAERLVTLTGLGGVGKTRLAVEYAHRHADQTGNRVVFVALADVEAGAEAILHVADALNIVARPGHDTIGRIEEELRRVPTLLVLDNLEQLVDEIAPTVVRLLAAAPGLSILCTTRHALELSDEQQLPVGLLPVPEAAVFDVPAVAERVEAPAARDPEDPSRLMGYACVQLFVDRARRTVPDFSVTVRNAHDVAEVCRRLEGLPLSLVLAAALVHDLTPRNMLARMGRKLDLLVSRKRDVPKRHATLEACLEWSYRLLPDHLRRQFATLSAFRSGWTLDAAEAVLDVGDGLNVLQDLGARSLITVDRSGDEARYGMLEVLRAFADTKLDGEDRARVEARHAAHFAALAAEAEPHLAAGGQLEWLPLLTADAANLREALRWCFQHDPVRGLRMARSLGRFWIVKGWWTEGRQWLQRAAETARSLGDAAAEGATLCLAGPMAAYDGDGEGARRLAERGIALLVAARDPSGLARGRVNLGIVLQTAGDLEGARAAYEDARVVAEQLGDRALQATALANLAGLHLQAEAYEAGRELAEEALALASAGRDRWLRGMLLLTLADIACELYDAPAARSRFGEAIELLAVAGDAAHAARGLRRLAAVQAYIEDHRGAATLLGAAVQTQEARRIRLDPDDRDNLAQYERDVRAKLPCADYEAAFALGRELEPADLRSWLEHRPT
jgi:predicted ATPase/DNA-binding SARP family transcriptional activator